MELKYKAIQAILVQVPLEAIGVVATRISNSEASVGEKVFLFESIGKAATEMANQKPKNDSEEQK